MIPEVSIPNQKKNQPLSFSSLPDEIIENILARISSSNYPNLSLVSKRFLSIISSPELYATRSHIKTTEPCLYFCLEDLPNISSPKWFSLRMKPANETPNNDDIIVDYSLVPVPSSHHTQHHVDYSSTVVVGSEIYLIGGPSNGPPSSLVRILECRSHTWRDGPTMSVARAGASAYFLHGKIYVMEKYRKDDDNWMEALDVKTQIWSPLLSHGATEFRSDWFLIRVFRGIIYAIADKTYAYDRNKGTWEVVDTYHMKLRYILLDCCVIENVIYRYQCDGFLLWYSYKKRKWIRVKGSDMELLRTHKTYMFSAECVLSMRSYGGKLLVMWSPKFVINNGVPERKIWCAIIALEWRRNKVWGKIEWVNEVLTVSTRSYKLLSCVVSWI
ncbi:unnamed protein product [Eruca vesicaria subsp. sativa]|uniref:F-box domain-containing protein n=1 Tax=Eruca vesicaria subsp. sativa TaxID=29727 RepID=A0ABC8JIT1_ERUVS|nr:unnamed protein product [Eruca vesicaria subsp. sativa]